MFTNEQINVPSERWHPRSLSVYHEMLRCRLCLQREGNPERSQCFFFLRCASGSASPLLARCFSIRSLLRFWKKANDNRCPHAAARDTGGLTTRCRVDTHRSLVHRRMRSPRFTTKGPQRNALHGKRGHPHPFSLQAWPTRPQNGNGPIVCVSGTTNRFGRRLHTLEAWIVVRRQHQCVSIGERTKPVLLQAKSQGKCIQHLVRQAHPVFVVDFPRGGKMCWFGRPPSRWKPRLWVPGSQVEHFTQIPVEVSFPGFPRSELSTQCDFLFALLKFLPLARFSTP